MFARPREFVDSAGVRWTATVISHGRTSGYLHPRVHRPIVEFACSDRPQPRRYTRLPPGRDELDDATDEELVALLGKAKAH